jgi:hypothetical protein
MPDVWVGSIASFWRCPQYVRISTLGKSGQTARQGSRMSFFCRRSQLAVGFFLRNDALEIMLFHGSYECLAAALNRRAPSAKGQDHGPGAPDISGSREGTRHRDQTHFLILTGFRQLALI